MYRPSPGLIILPCSAVSCVLLNENAREHVEHTLYISIYLYIYLYVDVQYIYSFCMLHILDVMVGLKTPLILSAGVSLLGLIIMISNLSPSVQPHPCKVVRLGHKTLCSYHQLKIQ